MLCVYVHCHTACQMLCVCVCVCVFECVCVCICFHTACQMSFCMDMKYLSYRYQHVCLSMCMALRYVHSDLTF